MGALALAILYKPDWLTSPGTPAAEGPEEPPDEQPDVPTEALAFGPSASCRGAWRNYRGVTAWNRDPRTGTINPSWILLASWRGDTMSEESRWWIENWLRSAYDCRFPEGVWAPGIECGGRAYGSGMYQVARAGSRTAAYGNRC